MKVFLDANVLFTAAHNSEGRAAALVALARQGFCSLHTSPHALEEARRNLRLKTPEHASRLEAHLATITVEAEAASSVVAWALEQGLPAEDAPILAAAVGADADMLVTGDRKHFGALYGTTLRGVEIVTPAQALDRVL